MMHPKPYPLSLHSATFPAGALAQYQYVVIFARYQEKWLFCRHKERTTIETAGGHIEPGETPLQAAKRELWEETGAEEAALTPLFDYAAENLQGGATGVIFLAEIETLGDLPAQFEMAERIFFDRLPDAADFWTYPAITPVLIEKIKEMGME
jgi:8-oxo-dGTP diphosphatase